MEGEATYTMLSEAVRKQLIVQVQKEWESQFYYLEMMAWCYNNELDGFGAWFERQAGEEHTHGLKILHYISDVGGEISIPSITAPPASFTSLLDTFEKTLAHEIHVTGLVHELVSLAQAEHDHTTYHFLQWFVNEQIEEESTARSIVGKLKRAGDNPSALLLIESQLGAAAPAAAKGDAT